jgi:hypothetical protein
MSNGVTYQELDTSLKAMVNFNRVRVQELLINQTTAKVVATLTPAAVSNFLVGIYLRPTGAGATVTVAVTYTDAGGAQSTILMNAQSLITPVVYSLIPLFINASAGAAITVTITANAANVVFASATITEV